MDKLNTKKIDAYRQTIGIIQKEKEHDCLKNEKKIIQRVIWNGETQ